MRSQHRFGKTGFVETFEVSGQPKVGTTSKVSTQVYPQVYLPGDLCVSLSIGCGVIWARCITAPLAIQ
jgi:hypothetical protein